MGIALGLAIGFVIWAFDVLAHRDLDYLVTGLMLALILGGSGFFSTSAKNGWRDTLLYFLLLGFLDN
jgi:hypothetical protein